MKLERTLMAAPTVARPADLQKRVPARAPERPVKAQLHGVAQTAVGSIVRHLGEPGDPSAADTRALQGFWGEMATFARSIPREQRALIQRVATEKVAALCVAVGRDASLGAAASMLIAMLAQAARQAPQTFETAADRITRIAIDATRPMIGRPGGHLALLAQRHLIDVLGLRPDGGDAIVAWRKLTGLVAGSLPDGSITQADIASLCRAFEYHLTHEVGLDAAIAATRAELRDALDLEREQAKRAIRGTTMARDPRVADALYLLIDRFPRGPRSLWQGVRELAAELANRPQLQPYASFFAEILLASPDAAAATNASRLFQRVLPDLPAGEVTASLVDKLREAGPEWFPALLGLVTAAQEFREQGMAAFMRIEPASLRWLVTDTVWSERLQPGVGTLLTGFADAFAACPELAELQDEDARSFCDRFASLTRALKPADATSCVDAARRLMSEPLASGAPELMQHLAAELHQHCPDVLPEDVLFPTADGEPGILALMQNGRPYDPRHLAGPLLAAVSHATMPALGVAAREHLVRFIFTVALELARLDRSPEVFRTAVGSALTKLCQPGGTPNQLPMLVRSPEAEVAGNIERLHSVAAQHPTFPVELLAPALVALEPATFAWLAARMAAQPTQEGRRTLRDLTIAAIIAGRCDVLETVRQLPGDVLMSLANIVGPLHRIANDHAIPWAEITEALAAGLDPGAVLEQKATRTALAAISIDINAPASGGVDLSDIKSCIGDVTALARFFASTTDWEGVAGSVFLEQLALVVRASAAGNWPAAKFEDAPLVAASAYGKLTPTQQDLWRAGFEARAGEPPKVDAGVYRPVLALAERIAADIDLLLRDKLSDHGAADAPALAALGTEHAELLERLRAAVRGTPEQIALAAKASRNQVESALRKVRAAALSPEKDTQPAKVVALLAEDAEAAAIAARRLGARDLTSALRELGHRAAQLPKPAADKPATAYARTTNALHAYVTSFRTGCLDPYKNHNSPSLVEFMRNPDYQVAHAHHGGSGPRQRNLMRLFRIDTDGYSGPAVFMDTPYVADSGGTATNESHQAYVRLLLEASRSLGIPAIAVDGGQWQGLAAEVVAAGRTSASKNVTFHVPHGATGVHQCETFSTYFVKAPAAGEVAVQRQFLVIDPPVAINPPAGEGT